MASADNQAIAGALDEIAVLLESQQANPYRVRAYRVAAESVRATETSLLQIYEKKGVQGFRELLGIGQTLASAIERLVKTGHYPLLDRLRGETRPGAVLRTIPTIGTKTEAELKSHLGIRTLRDLDDAMNAGSLARVPGMGPKRLATIRKALDERDLDDGEVLPTAGLGQGIPSVDELLILDAQYRGLAEAGKLPCLVPGSNDPTGRPRPIWHAIRSERNYTIVSARDEVTICLDDQDQSGCWTVITGRYGDLAGHRVIRGRIEECRRLVKMESKVEEARRQTLNVVKQARLELINLGAAP